MKMKATLCGLISAAMLAGCGSLSNLPQFELSDAGSSLTSFDSTDDNADPVAVADDGSTPPLPVRNTGRAGGNNDTKTAANNQPLLSLPSIEDVEIFTAAPAEPSTVSEWNIKPVAVYTKLAKQIHACWLNPAAPKLKDHSFHAEVGSGNAQDASITLFKKNEDGRRGLQAFRIEIQGTLSGSSVEAKNRRLEKSQDFAFRADLIRWAEGREECQI